MPNLTKHVVRTDLWLDAAFEARLGAEADIRLDVIPSHGDDARGWALLQDAHAFNLSPAKDELPQRLFVTSALLARCPNLLCVSAAGAGYDTVNVADCTAAGVAVVNQAGANADSVAEMALGLLLDVARRISECNRRLRCDTGFSRESVMGREIKGKILGIVGIGETGSRVARLARAFGMQVLAFDPLLSAATIAARGAEAVAFNDLLARADVVSLHCPRNQDTLKLMNAQAYAAMRRGAILISTARGGIHDEAALAAAIQSGHLAGAGLDVWEAEPPPLDHPLLQLPNVIATFHTAGVTTEARRNVAAWAAEQIVGVLKGERPPRLINPEVWPAYAARFERIFGLAPAAGTTKASV
jgi:D-3-phosphoglycerate dehydrogenase